MSNHEMDVRVGLVPEEKPEKEGLSRRSFLGCLGAVSATGVVGSVVGVSALANTAEAACEIAPLTNQQRRYRARKIRKAAAQLAFNRPLPDHPCNGEEDDYPYIANYSKGLPHNALGEVDPEAYAQMLKAIATEDEAEFEAVPLEGDRKLVNPHTGHAFDLEGPDSHHLQIRPAPRIDGPEHSAEMGEMYWHTLTRDVNFTNYETDPLIEKATADMSLFSDFRGPKEAGTVTPQTLFRIDLPGALAGPYLSQFLLKRIPYGTLTIHQHQKPAVAGLNYMAAPARSRFGPRASARSTSPCKPAQAAQKHTHHHRRLRQQQTRHPFDHPSAHTLDLKPQPTFHLLDLQEYTSH